MLVAADKPVYKNVATIEGGGKEKKRRRSKSKSKNRSSKSTRNSGSLGEVWFTTAKLVSEVGKKVEYKIVVTNTGNTTLKFSALKDAKCSGVLPAGETT